MNGYFQLIISSNSTAVRLVPPTDNGKDISIEELLEYLHTNKIEEYDLIKLKDALMDLREETKVPLLSNSITAVPETFKIQVSSSKMEAIARFYPPSNNYSGEKEAEEIIKELNKNKIIYGIDEDAIIDFTWSREYCKDIVVARGTLPEHGKDAFITYYFETDLRAKPQRKEDGSVDFFQLNTINHCKKDQLLAKLTLADPGKHGTDVFGGKINPREVKNLSLNFSINSRLSEDKLELYSTVNGNVSLVADKVFVSDVYEVENVGTATGNIDVKGSVLVNGNVQSGFSIKADGNVHVKGIVEGAVIEAGGDVIIERGMNGMGKGVINAQGKVIAKFFENAKVYSGEYVETNSILHSDVQAKTEINVDGRKGFIAGGIIRATNRVSCKILGSAMGADTTVEVGVDPEIKKRFQDIQKEIAENRKKIKEIQPILESTTQKIRQGVKFSKDQIKYIQSLTVAMSKMKEQLEEYEVEYVELEKLMSEKENAYISIRGEGYPGVKVSISNATMVLKKPVQFCRLVNDRSDIRVASF